MERRDLLKALTVLSISPVAIAVSPLRDDPRTGMPALIALGCQGVATVQPRMDRLPTGMSSSNRIID
ncbi:hypothetical protein [Thauera sp. SDU_THAU2]|uniref:hypothetical protein n=1 Tax=Thauera sp. SDU_THAU2 TaxID=3136633 RepID=UPI0031202212